ncbi:MAG: PilZ domain-containing protein [Deltaproteobacteria bacterium]
MNQQTESDRRTNHRVVVELWVEERTEDALYFQRATNLSIGGLFLDHTLPHPAGTRVQLELRLPGEPTPILVSGEVVPATDRDLGMGVRFVGLSQHERARIAEYLERAPFRVASENLTDTTH